MPAFQRTLIEHSQLRSFLRQYTDFVKANEDNSTDELLTMYLGAENPDENL